MIDRVDRVFGATDACQLLRQCLSGRHAMNLDGLIRELEVDRETVMKAVGELVASKEVEILRPLSMAREPMSTGHPSEHYRLVRPSDRSYLWEQQIGRQTLPVDRVFKMQQQEVARPRESSRISTFFRERLTRGFGPLSAT